MDYASIGSLITSVGFPIVACIIMGLYIKSQTNEYRQDVKDLNNKYNEDIKHFTEALNNNTMVIQRLVDKLDLDK